MKEYIQFWTYDKLQKRIVCTDYYIDAWTAQIIFLAMVIFLWRWIILTRRAGWPWEGLLGSLLILVAIVIYIGTRVISWQS